MRAIFTHSKVDLAVEPGSGLGENGLRLRVRLNSNDASNRCDIGNLWRSWVNLMHIRTGIVWTLTGVPERLPVTVTAMMLGAMPLIGLSMGVVIFRVNSRWIWSGLGGQGT